MKPTASTALSPVDAARLWMGTGDNPMVVTAVRPLDEATLRRLLRDRLLMHDRFRARIDLPHLPWNPPRWREDPDFSLDRHVARVALRPGSTEADLARAVSNLASLPLPLDHPPWRAWLLDGVGPGPVLVVRVHHAIADGRALLGVLFAVCDEGDGALPPPEAPAPARASLPPPAELLHGAASLGRLLLQRPDAAGLLADVIGDALDGLLTEPAIVLGDSLGGAVALGYALRCPERVRGLVLVSPAGFGHAPQLEQPGRLAARVVEFAKDCVGSGGVSTRSRGSLQSDGLTGLMRDLTPSPPPSP